MSELLYKASPDDGQASGTLVLCDRVQALANEIYREFEILVGNYGDGAIKDLMPQVVSILESLNVVYTEKQEQEVEVELLHEEVIDLKLQFEKEKILRKMAEQKYLEMEDGLEEERREREIVRERQDSTVRRLEVKLRNLQEQLSRQEERKAELKEENIKLQQRYTEMMKNHAELMDRSKLSSDRSGDWSSPRVLTMPPVPLKQVMKLNGFNEEEIECNDVQESYVSSNNNNYHLNGAVDGLNLKSELLMQDSSPTCIMGTNNEQIESVRRHVVHSNTPSDTSNVTSSVRSENAAEKDLKTSNNNNNNTDSKVLFSSNRKSGEFNHSDWMISPIESFDNTGTSVEEFDEEVDHPASAHILNNINDCSTGSQVVLRNRTPLNAELSTQRPLSDTDTDLSVMGAEIEKIIQENNELLATKHALNVVKDDLICQLDDLTGEQELLREELRCVVESRDKLDQRVGELEDQLKNCKEELEEARNSLSSENRFSRADMARVIMDRNNYKEKLMELQEAVRYAEMLRVSRDHPDIIDDYTSPHPSASPGARRKGPLFNFFSRLGGGKSKSTTSTSVDPQTDPSGEEKDDKTTVVKSAKPSNNDQDDS